MWLKAHALPKANQIVTRRSTRLAIWKPAILVTLLKVSIFHIGYICRKGCRLLNCESNGRNLPADVFLEWWPMEGETLLWKACLFTPITVAHCFKTGCGSQRDIVLSFFYKLKCKHDCTSIVVATVHTYEHKDTEAVAKVRAKSDGVVAQLIELYRCCYCRVCRSFVVAVTGNRYHTLSLIFCWPDKRFLSVMLLLHNQDPYGLLVVGRTLSGVDEWGRMTDCTCWQVVLHSRTPVTHRSGPIGIPTGWALQDNIGKLTENIPDTTGYGYRTHIRGSPEHSINHTWVLDVAYNVGH